jgi:hypothetical protein
MDKIDCIVIGAGDFLFASLAIAEHACDLIGHPT